MLPIAVLACGIARNAILLNVDARADPRDCRALSDNPDQLSDIATAASRDRARKARRTNHPKTFDTQSARQP
jgi:hypothetical protein